MTTETTLKIGDRIRLTRSIGHWPTGTVGKIIPCPIKVIPYDKINLVGDYKHEQFEAKEATIWVRLLGKLGDLDPIPTVPVAPYEIEAAK